MRTMPYNLSGSSSTAISSALYRNKSITSKFDKDAVALSTGKKINTSYDNSTLYFKDMRLSERAEGISGVLDGLSTIVTELNAFSSNIDSLSDLLQLAKSLANSARDSINYIKPIVGNKLEITRTDMLSNLTGVATENKKTPPGKDTFLLRTGDADKVESDYLMTEETTLKDLGLTKGEEFNIKIGEHDWITLRIDNLDLKVTDFFGQISNKLEKTTINEDGSTTKIPGDDIFDVSILEGKLTLTTTDLSPILIDDATDYEDENKRYSTLNAFGFDMSNTLQVSIEDDWNVQNLMDSINKQSSDIIASINQDGHLEVTSIYGKDLVISDQIGNSAYAFGISGFSDTSESDRANYANRYNDLLKQIDSLVDDSYFNGINLLKGDSIQAIFSENGDTYRTIHGTMLDSNSLGLGTAIDSWQNPSDISNVIANIDSALEKLERVSSSFDRASAMIQSRDTFMTAISGTFQKSATKLTEADANEVAIEQLSINTQQQLINQVISLTLEANSSVLSLF